MFTQSATLYDAIYGFKDYTAEAAELAALVRGACAKARTVLDAGCGTGEHVRLLVANHGFEADGLDADSGLIAIARRKHAAGHFFVADMSDFALSRTYDAILCLFGSIGYLVTLERVRQAFRCFRTHLSPSGVVIVEPWFAPGVLEPGRVSRQTGEAEGCRVERVSRLELSGRISRLHFDYHIEDQAGRRLVHEVHELGLFSPQEMSAAFADAGFAADFYPAGLTGRGLWVARLVA